MDHIYAYKSASEEVLKPEAVMDEHVTTRVELESGKGTRIFLQGEKYPIKGVTTPEAVVAVNLVKRVILNYMKLLMYPPFLPITLLCLPFYKRIGRKALPGFVGTVKKTITPFLLKPEYQQRFTCELEKMLTTFMDRLGVSDPWIPTIFAHIFEYDSAYRTRLQDAFTESSKEELVKNPRKEVVRIFNLIADRDNKGTAKKFRLMIPLVSSALIIPRIRRAFRLAVSQSEFSDLQYDRADKYWALKRTDYNPLGLSYEVRKAMLETYE